MRSTFMGVAALALASGSMTAAAAEQGHGAYAAVNGIRMYYETYGPERGVPLVLLHGGGSTIDSTFGRIIPFLARDRRVIAVEEQAHGRTSDRDAPVRFETSADDVATLLDATPCAAGRRLRIQQRREHCAAGRAPSSASGAQARVRFIVHEEGRCSAAAVGDDSQRRFRRHAAGAQGCVPAGQSRSGEAQASCTTRIWSGCATSRTCRTRSCARCACRR